MKKKEMKKIQPSFFNSFANISLNILSQLPLSLLLRRRARQILRLGLSARRRCHTPGRLLPGLVLLHGSRPALCGLPHRSAHRRPVHGDQGAQREGRGGGAEEGWREGFVRLE